MSVISNIQKFLPLISLPPSSSSPPQFVIRLPRGPLLDFYSKRSWGAVSTLRSSHTGVSVTRGDRTLSICTHQPLALSSLPLLLQHHCSILHLPSSAPLETLSSSFCSCFRGTGHLFLLFLLLQQKWLFSDRNCSLKTDTDWKWQSTNSFYIFGMSFGFKINQC